MSAILQVCTLQQFAETHADHAQRCAARLAEFSDAVYSTVEEACRDALIQLQQHLETLTVKSEAGEGQGMSMSGGHSNKLGHSMSGHGFGSQSGDKPPQQVRLEQ